MNKITKVISLLLVMVLMFTGCNANTEVTINEDKSVKVVSTMETLKSEVELYMKTLGYSDADTFMYDSYGKDNVEKYTNAEGKECYKVTQTESYPTLNEYAQMTEFVDGLYLKKDTVYGVTDYTSEETMEGIEVKYSYTFVFPYSIKSTNGTVNTEKPNAVTFDVSTTGKTTIFATTNSSVTMDKVKKIVKESNKVARPVIKSVKVKKYTKNKASVTLKIKKIKGVKYSIECATNKKFTKNPIYKETKKNKVVLKGLKRGKTYYFRVVAFKKNYCGFDIYSYASKIKKIKLKKAK